jgi:hypothetical protein
VAPAKRKRKSGTSVQEANQFMTAVKQKMENRDEFSIFGEYVASKLHKLEDPRLQSISQNRITNMLFDMEMGNVNHLV